MCKAMWIILKPMSCCTGWRTTLVNYKFWPLERSQWRWRLLVENTVPTIFSCQRLTIGNLFLYTRFTKAPLANVKVHGFLPWQLFNLLKGRHKSEGQSTTVAKGSLYLITRTKGIYFYNYWGLPCHIKSQVLTCIEYTMKIYSLFTMWEITWVS